ncbi:MAG: isopenicillin N-epimerase [Polyangiaceae bacterium]|jgi:isopenicillin-N epimerase|nr:isopenicillin N-epimerase [Polyangiaceae bacterium]
MRSPFAVHWRLDPDVTFLNHGSFGACPGVVLDAQSRLRERLEREPVRFMIRDLEGLLAEARAALGRFLGAQPDDLAFVPNASSGVSTVLRSLALSPGDELLTTDHTYGACRNALAFAAEASGARVVVAPVPFPLESSEEVVSAVLASVTARTRLLLIDHVTSPTALIFPVERLVRELRARGVDTLVDGAHAPGMLPLGLDALGAAYYTANCHKWLCAPKGSAFLHVRRDRQGTVRPLTLSHGAASPRRDVSRFRLEHDWTGTVDPSAYLAVPHAIEFLEQLMPGGLPALQAHNHSLALYARATLCRALGIAPPAPESLLGSMVTLPLPPGPGPAEPSQLEPLQDELFFEHHLELPVFRFGAPDRRFLRVTAQAYNRAEDYDRLATALS